MADSCSNKRRRATAAPLHLTDLPDNILKDVASYLSKPQRALFAASVTAPSESWERRNWTCKPSPTSLAIVSSPTESWQHLDFVDIEKDLAHRIIDGDLGAVLACIGAANNLKVLRLTGCLDVTGSGLEPLRASTTIEHLDLSLAKQHGHADISNDESLEVNNVSPVLRAIITVAGSSLKLIRFPKTWKAGVKRTEFIDFLEDYNGHLQNRHLCCSKCRNQIPDQIVEHFPWANNSFGVDNHVVSTGNFFGVNTHVCTDCLNIFCHYCRREDGNQYLLLCRRCQQCYCKACSGMSVCDICTDRLCSGCANMQQCILCQANFCQQCGSDHKKKCSCGEGPFCGDCAHQIRHCQMEGCDVSYCSGCKDDSSHNLVRYCEFCDTDYCVKCRLSEFRVNGWRQSCKGCLQAIGPELAIENEDHQREIKDRQREIKKLQEKISQLAEKFETCQSENKRLQHEMNELQKKAL